MELRPILSTLRRHKTAALLIVVEIALSCAIICNALFLIGTRLDRMQRPSGLAEKELVRIEVNGIARNSDAMAVTRADLVALRQIPGVRSVSAVNQLPFGNSSWNSSIQLEQDQSHANMNAAVYLGDQTLLGTMGLTLVEGRNFQPDEVLDWDVTQAPGANRAIPSTIVTRSVAESLFPGESAIGKTFYAWGDAPHRIVGVVENLMRPNERGGPAQTQYSFLLPIHPSYERGSYLIRVQDPTRRQAVIDAALKTLEGTGPTRILPEEDAVSFEQMRNDYYRQDRAMAWLLVTVCVALLVVTALGIVGLASFWVQQRRRTIGIRRALGATRGQILRYFQTENFLLATMGIVLGMLLAYAINQWLMQAYELPRLPLAFLPVGALALWLLGQVAVLGPARRAAAVPPAVATRTA
ncbi:ABC transporter permease [Coralloluteibacterium stylophorae]|uniref:ABC transporter permease n=1 Tax=Coralloluteibacterium stylophorae TaxID=1776034 RepID=A0A8J7VWD3_9GAMM|nr:FtsX-like permease family protein [Coralloluteibacterium stylophorae]MBS7457981.1 ABC transporter permease [Coralloluteibacterium stylophorae]